MSSKSENLIRQGAVGATLGGVLFVGIFTLLSLGQLGVSPALKALEDKHWLFHIFEAPIMALIALGVAGLYRYQAERFGKLGKAGAYLAMFGFAVAALGGVAVIVVELGTGTNTAEGILDVIVHLPSYFPFTIGSLLFGIATLRAGMLPRAAAGVLAFGAGTQLLMTFIPLQGLPRLIPAVAIGLGWALLGMALLAAGAREANRRQLATA